MVWFLAKTAIGVGAASLIEKGAREMDYEALKDNPKKELERVASFVGEEGKNSVEAALISLANMVGVNEFAHPSDLIVDGYRPDELIIGLYRNKNDRPVTDIEVDQVNYLVEHIGQALPKKYVPTSLTSNTRSKDKLLGLRVLTDIIGYAEPSPESLKKHLIRNLSTLNKYITRTMAGEDMVTPIENLQERRDITEEEISLIDGNKEKFEAVMGRWAQEWVSGRFQYQE